MFQFVAMIHRHYIAVLIGLLGTSLASSCTPVDTRPSDTSSEDSDKGDLSEVVEVSTPVPTPAPIPTPAPPPLCPEADLLEALDKEGTNRIPPPALSEDQVQPQSPIDQEATRVAAAWCLVRSGKPQRGRKLLEVGGADELPLRNYARLVAGEAALLLDEPAVAEALLHGLHFPEGPAQRRLQNLRGTALIRSGKPTEGRRELEGFLVGSWGKPGKRPEPSGGHPAEARWWLARAARDQGDEAAEALLLKKIWTLHPGFLRERELLARLAETVGEFPDLKKPAHAALVRQRIATLERTYHWKEALALRDQLPPPTGPKGRAALARVVLKARDYPRAFTLYAALKNPGLGELFNHAVVATRTGNYAKATELYRGITARFGGEDQRPPNKTADQASYKIGYLAYDSARFETAITEFRAHLKRYPRSRYAESTRWFIAWSLIKLHRLDAAKGALGRLKQHHPRSSMVAAADYWVARIAGMQGDPERQRKGLSQILDDYPVSSYAWFAAHALGRTWKPRPTPAPALRPEVENLAEIQRGRALAQAGLDAWGRAEVRSVKAGLRRGKPEIVLAYAEALSATGAWAEARKLVLARCKPAVTAGDDPSLARLCWPRPLGDVPAQAAHEGGVSPHLPFAIMRAETGWKPWLTSPAGASGLMQVMPSLGESLTRDLYPERHWDPLDLYDPSTNAELGVAELVSLNKRFEDTGVLPRTPLIIAGYNGGETAVRRWLGLYDSPPPADVFAEDVGYTETRRYVRKVLATLMAYRYVYGDKPREVPVRPR